MSDLITEPAPDTVEPPRDQTLGAALLTRLERVEAQLGVVRSLAARRPRRGPGLVRDLLLLGALAATLLLLVQSQSALTRLQSDQATQADYQRAALARQVRQVDGLVATVGRQGLESLPTRAAAAVTAQLKTLGARETLQKRIGELEERLAAVTAQRDATARKHEVAATRLHFVASQLAALESERDRLRKQLARQQPTTRRPAPTAAASPKTPDPITPTPELDGWVARLNELLSHGGREQQLKVVSAAGFYRGRFQQLLLEERKGRRVTRRIWAGATRLELHSQHAVVRLRIEGYRALANPDAKPPGRELRLPQFTLEQYDVDVKAWRTLAGSWLTVR